MPTTQVTFLEQLSLANSKSGHPPAEGEATASSSLHQELSANDRGAVYTRPEVVAFMLDLAGYLKESDLTLKRVLEPAAGDGAFAVQIVDRVVRSFLAHGGTSHDAAARLQHCLVAVEVFEESAAILRARLATTAEGAGLGGHISEQLAAKWVIVGDSLLTDFVGSFDLVIGNPPYVRQESIPAGLLTRYRQRYATLFNRADLYVLFFELGLSLLRPGGKLAFLCSDRWMKCAYGKPLRALVAEHFSLDAFVDMVDTQAFTSEVVAYPAITVISRNPPTSQKTLAAFRPTIDTVQLQQLASGFAAGNPSTKLGIRLLESVVTGSAPWLLDGDGTLPLVRSLEKRFPLLEACGCRVGIGVATGCDRVFIDDFERLAVEPERKLRLVMADCIRSGQLVWGGKGLVNPFEPDGSLAEPRQYPLFAAFLKHNETALKKRNVAQRSGDGWYRTIDRIWDHLTATPKLLIPDIKGEPNVVIDSGEFYPHHNLYWVTSQEWGLQELQAILRSSIAKLFVASYCVKMANGFLRFQAQYIRRIRLPQWNSVSASQRVALREAVQRLDQTAIDEITNTVYGLDQDAIATLQRFRDSFNQ